MNSSSTPANHSRQDISASVVKEAVIQTEQGGLGGVAAKEKKQNKNKIAMQQPTPNRINGPRGWEHVEY